MFSFMFIDIIRKYSVRGNKYIFKYALEYFQDRCNCFILFFLSVKARTAQLAKIKWVISVVFYILQVSVLLCHLGSLRSLTD